MSISRRLNGLVLSMELELRYDFLSDYCQVPSNFFFPFTTKAFSVIITGRNGKLEVARMNTEEPLDKANSGQPRVGYLPIFLRMLKHIHVCV